MYFPSFSGRSGGAGAGTGAASSPPGPVPAASPPGKAAAAAGGDITGRFDPTALERGAKALKELDASPNASRAFELTKLQEQTRQAEVARDVERMQVSRAQLAAERARAEGEERRKSATHQQEQERITAQYRAQLEAEAYAKKLQDQQAQNREWLEQQHQQFLRQEQVRKANEKEILDMRRAQLREEKAMEKELQAARIREEAGARIRQERENIDVHLRQLRARAAEERKTKLDVVAATLSSLGAGGRALLDDRAKMLALVGGLTAVAVGVYSARAGAGVAAKFVEARIGKPPLVRETSRWAIARQGNSLTLAQLAARAARRLPLPAALVSLPGRRGAAAALREKIVLPAELAERLEWTANAMVNARRNGMPFRHLLLYGHPGTGKTLFARTLARESGMDYAIMSGGDVAPLGRDAVNEINRLFNWANQSKKGLILFVDEAEAFLRQGRGSADGAGMSENTRNVLSAFLHHTGTESEKFCVILATNIRDILDRAVLDRVDEQFEFPLPGVGERRKMLDQFFDIYLRPRGGMRGAGHITIAPDVDDSLLDMIARRTEGFSGRQVAKLVIGMQAAVFGSGTNVLTRGLAETVLNWRLAHLAEDQEMQKREQPAGSC